MTRQPPTVIHSATPSGWDPKERASELKDATEKVVAAAKRVGILEERSNHKGLRREDDFQSLDPRQKPSEVAKALHDAKKTLEDETEFLTELHNHKTEDQA